MKFSCSFQLCSLTYDYTQEPESAQHVDSEQSFPDDVLILVQLVVHYADKKSSKVNYLEEIGTV